MSNTRRLALAASIAGVATPLAANAGTLTTLYTFQDGTDGRLPSSLVYQDGELYGTTPGQYDGGKAYGNVFKVNAATGAFKVVYAFQGGTDGDDPLNGLAYQNDVLYGTTFLGGSGVGTVFSVNIKTHAEAAYTLSGFGGLIELTYAAGLIYGLAESGGANSDGGIFSFDPTTGAITPAYSFSGHPDGQTPAGRLLFENGLLYGTTMYGGDVTCHLGGCGTLFAFNPANGTESIVRSLGGKGGKYPIGALAYYSGSFVGDTYLGGNQACKRGCGVSYKIKATTGRESVLSDFANDGERYSGITIVNGNAYETLPAAGNGSGELLQVDLKSGHRKILYTFTGGSDGSDPQAALTYHDGAFYGTTEGGNCTVFKFVP